MNTVLFLLPPAITRRVGKRFRGIGDKLSFVFPGLGYDLVLAESELTQGEYIIACIFNSLIWALLMLVLMTALLYSRGAITQSGVQTAFSSLDALKTFVSNNTLVFAPTIASLVLTFILFIRYPTIIAGKSVEAVDKDLIYALQDLTLQINSGVSLYEALRNVSRAGYGKVSEEFVKVVQDISTGEPQEKALEKMALRTQSEFLRRTIWQLVTALKAGASLQGALTSILLALRRYQDQNVKTYTHELNLWVLLYIFVAVAIPSLFTTLLVILSTFGGLGVNESFMIILMLLCFAGEFVLVEYIKIRRPVLRV